MDGAGDDVVGWLADGLAAAVLGAAIGACLLLLGSAEAGVLAAAVSGTGALAGLRQVKPEPRRFRLPAFAVADQVLEEAQPDVLELCDLEDAEHQDDALLLDDPLSLVADDSRVVQLFAPRPLPTPGELQQRIQAHLTRSDRAGGSGNVLDLHVDAAAALRQALGELRRNLA